MSIVGPVPGADVREQAVRVAGALAELGVIRLILESEDGSPRELKARETDLPGVIAASPGCVLAAPEWGITVRIRTDDLEWEALDVRSAAVWEAALAEASGGEGAS